MSRPLALVLGRQAGLLLGSRLSDSYRLLRFEGGPLRLVFEVLARGAHIVHIEHSIVHLVAARLGGARVVFHPAPDTPQWALGLADVLVVRTDTEREHYERKCPGRYVAVVPQGIDAAPYLKYNRRTPDPARPLKLLHLGQQGMPLEVLAQLRLQRVQALLTIAGSGPRLGLLRARSRALGLAGQVTFAAPAWGEYKAKLLRDADVLFVGGEGGEALEGMAAGVVPVEAGETPEAAVSAVAGLHADRARLARMSHAGRQRILSEHSLERMADDFTAIYSLLVSWPASQAG